MELRNPLDKSENETDATVYSVVDVKVHEGWNPQEDTASDGGEGEEELRKPYDNDIAILTLDRQGGSLSQTYDIHNFPNLPYMERNKRNIIILWMS